MQRWVFIALLWAGYAAVAQGRPSSPSATETLHARSTLVLVPTLVRDSAGDLVPGLKAGDFRITDNGIEQKVSLLDAPELQPIAILAIVQTGGAAARQFENYRTLTTMLDYLGGAARHEVGVLTFDSRPEDIWTFTPNAGELADAFLHPVAGDHGAAVLDAVDYGIGLLSKEPPGMRRIILLLSQPQDDGSKIDAEDVVRHLGEHNITIFSVSFSPEQTWLKDQFTKPRQGNPPYRMSPDHAPILYTFNLSAPLAEALKAMRLDTAAEIATLSGGEHVRFGDRRSLDQHLATLANHIPNRYLLSFQPSSDTPGFHTIQVRVLRQPSALDVSARAGYWSDAPDTAK